MLSEPNPAVDGTSDLAAILPDLLRRAGVARVAIETVKRPPSFRGGTVSAQAQAITQTARAEHARFGFGFWEYTLAQAADSGPETRRALIRGALRHTPPSTSERLELDLDDFAHGLRFGVWTGLPARVMTSLCSTVVSDDGTRAWLPLIDLGLDAATPGSVQAAADAIQELGLGGALFTSGRSFHFVGDTLAPPERVTRSLARALLLSPLIDSRWIAHQLIDGECRLRISTDLERNSQPHHFVQMIHSA